MHFIELDVIKTTEGARTQFYVAQEPRKAEEIGRVDICVWEEYFGKLLNIEETKSKYNHFTTDEVRKAILIL